MVNSGKNSITRLNKVSSSEIFLIPLKSYNLRCSSVWYISNDEDHIVSLIRLCVWKSEFKLLNVNLVKKSSLYISKKFKIEIKKSFEGII